tara:strand:+ start:1223 stop:1420 length:198 start_codon:yes stop_codon:yes gene_type:complete
MQNVFGENLLRKQTIMNVSIVDKNIMNMILPLTMYIPEQWEVMILLATAFPHVGRVIRVKGVRIG